MVIQLKKFSFIKNYSLKRILIVIFCLVIIQQADAQSDSLPIYKRFPEIPPFSITKVPDSIKFTKDDLQKKRSTMIMLFNPDCKHCQLAIQELLSNITLFKNAQIVLASPMDFVELKKFYKEYKIASYPNITVARDWTFFFGSFYVVKNFPSVYIYNIKGELSAEFSGSLDIIKAAAAL